MSEGRIAILLDAVGDQKESVSEIQAFKIGDAVLFLREKVELVMHQEGKV